MTLNQQTRIQQLIKSLRKMGKANLEIAHQGRDFGKESVGAEQIEIANLLAEMMENE